MQCPLAHAMAICVFARLVCASGLTFGAELEVLRLEKVGEQQGVALASALSVEFTLDGSKLLVCRRTDNKVSAELLSVPSMRSIARFDEAHPISARLSRDGVTVVIADLRLRLWDITSGATTIIADYSDDDNDYYLPCPFISKHRLPVVNNSQAEIWNVTSKTYTTLLPALKDVCSIDVTMDGKFLVAGNERAEVDLVELADAGRVTRIRQAEMHGVRSQHGNHGNEEAVATVRCVRFAKNADEVAVLVNKDEEPRSFVELWRRSGRSSQKAWQLAYIINAPGERHLDYDMEYDCRGRFLAVADYHGEGIVFDTQQKRVTATFAHHELSDPSGRQMGDRIFDLAYSSDSSLLATAHEDGTVILWDAAAVAVAAR